MNDFICILKPTRIEMLTAGPTDQEAQIVTSHFEFWKSKHETGDARLAGRTENNDSKTFGVVIFKAKGLEDARSIASEDPAIRKNVMSFEVFPFRVAIGE